MKFSWKANNLKEEREPRAQCTTIAFCFVEMRNFHFKWR